MGFVTISNSFLISSTKDEKRYQDLRNLRIKLFSLTHYAIRITNPKTWPLLTK